MQHLQPNTTLQGGKYRIERVLGQGGFGNTYVSVNTVFNERVAIKEFFMRGVSLREDDQISISISVPENKDSFNAQKDKFKKEALRIRQLKNEHIVTVHDLFEENGTAYYVMDYVDGENLAERLKRTGKPMTEQEVRQILPQILDALKTVHNAGIWHLDLKPANIMIDNKGNIKLIDFGASKQLNVQKGGATTSTAISYTNGFAPREQMEQNYDKFGPWTDLYALGATLYNLLTRKHPPLPSDIDDDESCDKHLALPFSDGVSDDMKQLVLQLMQTNRKQRPHSVSEVLPLMGQSGQSAKSVKHSEKPKESKIEENYDSEVTIIANPQSEATIIEHKTKAETPTIVTPTKSVNNTYSTVVNKEESNSTRNVIIGGIICVVLVFIYIATRGSGNSYDSPAPVVQNANQVVSAPPSYNQSAPVSDTKTQSPAEMFDSKINSCRWLRNTSGTYNFNYPDFMSLSSYFMEDVPADVEVYSWQTVQLAYWPLLGAWAVDSFAESGNWISNNAQISNVTYKLERKGIYSGYTTDGRIYYLKKKILDGGEVPHATVLALIYTEDFRDHMDELTNLVMRW